VSVEDANVVGAPDNKNTAMSVPFIQRSLPDTKLESGKEQFKSKWGLVLLSKMLSSTILGMKG
jgi:hypothetical protein